jgi:hypothetical protein
VTAFHASAWQIAVAALLPILFCLLLFLAEAKGPLSRIIRQSTGLVGAYFTAISILFGLFAALLASDVWMKTNEAKRAVQAESHAVHAIAHLARAHGMADAVLPKLRAYVEAAGVEQPHSDFFEQQHAATEKAYLDLLTTLSRLPPTDDLARSSLLTAGRELLRAHDNRIYFASDMTAPVKWLSIVIFGVLTQIALLLVHVENRRASRLAVVLFTVAFSFCLLVMAVFDAPFEVVLKDEPAKSMRMALEKL